MGQCHDKGTTDLDKLKVILGKRPIEGVKLLIPLVGTDESVYLDSFGKPFEPWRRVDQAILLIAGLDRLIMSTMDKTWVHIRVEDEWYSSGAPIMAMAIFEAAYLAAKEE